MIDAVRRRRLMMTTVALMALIGSGAIVWLLANGRSGPVPNPPEIDAATIADPHLASYVQETIDRVKRSPRDPDLRRLLGEVYFANGFPDEATDAFQQAASMNPDDPRSWYLLALTHAEVGRLDAAIGAIEQAARRNQDYAPIHWRKGLWLMDLHRIDEAEAAFRAARETDDRDPGGTIGLVRVALQRDDPDRVIALCKESLARHGNNDLVRRLLARAYRAKGMDRLAAEEESRATPGSLSWRDPWRVDIDKHRRGYKATVEQAQQLLQAGQPAEAARMLETILPTYPDDVPLLVSLCAAYHHSNQIDRAMKLMLDAQRRNSDHFAVQLNLAQLYAAQQQYDRALQHANRAVDLNPTLAAAHIARGDILLRSEQPGKAIAALEEAIRQGGTDLQSLQLLGDSLRAAGRFDDALKTYAQAARDYPNHAAPLVGLAATFAVQGNLDAANAALRDAQRINPNDPGVVQVRNWLLQLNSGAGPRR